MKKTSYHDPLGLLELEFCFKDTLLPKRNFITRDNKEYFDYIKRDINYIYEKIVEQVLELSEFTILVIPTR